MDTFLRRVPFDSPFAATVALRLHGECWRYDRREIESRWSVGGEPSAGSINDAADHCGIDVLDGVIFLSGTKNAKGRCKQLGARLCDMK